MEFGNTIRLEERWSKWIHIVKLDRVIPLRGMELGQISEPGQSPIRTHWIVISGP